MTTLKKRSILWIYDRNHCEHPFIRIAAKSICEYGFNLTIIDRGKCVKDENYQHIFFNDELVFTDHNIFQFQFFGWCKKYFSCSLFEKIKKIYLTSLWIWLFLPWVIFRSWKISPDCIIATRPEMALAGFLISRLCKSRFIYYPFELYGEQTSREFLLFLMMEQFALKRVDVLITQNEKRAEFYIRNKKVRVSPVIIHNYKPYEKVQQSNTLKKLLKLPNETRVIVYEGQIQGRRNLDKIVLSAKYLPDTFRLVFIGEILGTWWEESVKPLFVDPEIASRVIVMPPYPHDELIEIIAFSDVGIIIYDDSVLNNIFCEPGKLSDYIFARVPVIAPDYPTIGPVIKKYKIGQTFENAEPEEIARVIEKVVNTPREVWEQGLDAASLELTWENEWPKLKEVLE